MDIKELIALADKARQNSYSPYSGFSVGAALLTADGEIYTGCNIENASFTPTVCAERTAIFKAVSDGVKRFSAIAVISSDKNKHCMPCGVCRQVLGEFCGEDFKIICAKDTENYKEFTLSEMLPFSFNLGENE